MAQWLRRDVNASWLWHSEAVSNYVGSAQFRTVWDEGSAIVREKEVGDNVLTVPVVTLDAWAEKELRPGERIAVLKVDAEGQDGKVLVGARSLLAANRVEALVFERPLNFPVSFRGDDDEKSRIRSETAFYRYLFDNLGFNCYLPGRKVSQNNVLLTHTKHTLLALRDQPGRPCPIRNVICAHAGSALDRALFVTSIAFSIANATSVSTFVQHIV